TPWLIGVVELGRFRDYVGVNQHRRTRSASSLQETLQLAAYIGPARLNDNFGDSALTQLIKLFAYLRTRPAQGDVTQRDVPARVPRGLVGIVQTHAMLRVNGEMLLAGRTTIYDVHPLFAARSFPLGT